MFDAFLAADLTTITLVTILTQYMQTHFRYGMEARTFLLHVFVGSQFAGGFCVVVTDSLPDSSCLMREPGCQRFDQSHPRDAPRLPVRQLQGPARPQTLPGFLFLSSFGATQPTCSCLLILFPIR